jgi:hypothetical protein
MAAADVDQTVKALSEFARQATELAGKSELAGKAGI